MKYQLCLSISFFLLIACSDNKTANETTAPANKQQPEPASNAGTNQPSGDGIAGYWKLTLECYDDNGNKVPDADEKKKGIKNNYLLCLNADGSCRIQEFYNGRYEVKMENEKKMLYVYRNRIVGEEEKDPPPDIYRIISVGTKELVLLENEGNLVFWLLERAG